VVAACIVAALVAIAGAANGTAARRTSCTPSWAAVPSADVPGGELASVAATSATDAWAVGGRSGWWWVTPAAQTFVEHWDGSTWTLVPSPALTGTLDDVAAFAPDDAWAVGRLYDDAGDGIAEHWDGSGWTQVALPGMGRLAAVSASSSRDVWAVGEGAKKNGVVLRWNGSAWKRALSRPKLDLRDVLALSHDDVWVVGDVDARRFLELHWDGKRWTSYTQPSPDGGYGPDESPELTAVAAGGENDVWVAGDAENSGDPDWADTVLFHWNGHTWRSAAPDRAMIYVESLVTLKRGELWLDGVGGDHLGWTPAVQLWRGGRWGRTQDTDTFLDAIGADRTGGLWGVGYDGSGEDDDNGFPARSTPSIERMTCT